MFFPTLQTNFHTFQSLLKSGSASQPQTDKSGPDGERVTRKERERERGKNRPETQKRRQSANCLNSWLLLRVQQRCSLGGHGAEAAAAAANPFQKSTTWVNEVCFSPAAQGKVLWKV
jgi:hypothetical protein